MKLKTMQKRYCPTCKNQILCEMKQEGSYSRWADKTPRQQIKWFGTGAIDSENKLFSLERMVSMDNFSCPVLAEIMKIRFYKKIENLTNQISRLEDHKVRLKRDIEKCNTIIPKMEEVMSK